MEIYLDNAATTKAFDSVKRTILKTLEEDYGNPSSMHLKGVEAEKYIKDAKEIIAKSMKADIKEIIFTSGGTESNNHALFGAAFANRRAGNHIITTCIEHPSVYNPMVALEEAGFNISYIPVDSNGIINIKKLEEAISSETILVSVMYVNNEIGSVQPIEEISKIIKSKNKDILFHVDAIQAFGKYNIYPRRLGIDLMSVSGHKIHGPKGIGILYARDRIKIKPFIYGGGQQNGRRSGTENVSGIAGIGQAVREIYIDHEKNTDRLYKLKELFINKVKELEGININGVMENIRETAPHIISVSFEGIRSEVLLHALEDRKIYVSAGSACSSNHPKISGTLKAIGVKKELLDSTLRFSFSIFTTEEEIIYTIDELRGIVPILRRYGRR